MSSVPPFSLSFHTLMTWGHEINSSGGHKLSQAAPLWGHLLPEGHQFSKSFPTQRTIHLAAKTKAAVVNACAENMNISVFKLNKSLPRVLLVTIMPFLGKI